MAELIAVTGASGTVGGLVAARLAAAGVPTRLIGRDDTRLPDLDNCEHAVASGYADTEAMQRALAGASAVLLVSARESADRVAEHRSAIDAAVAAGVQRIVYTSFYGARPDCTFTFGRDHWHTEQYIRDSGLGFTFLRDNFYLGVLPLLAADDGVIRGPAGDGRVAAVAQADVAEVAARMLTGATCDGTTDDGAADDGATDDGTTWDLTGPQALSLAEVASILALVSGRRVRYEEETVDEAYASRAHYGAPAFEVDGWVSTYAAIANGELAGVTDTVQRLTGRPPLSLREHLAAHPASWAHLR